MENSIRSSNYGKTNLFYKVSLLMMLSILCTVELWGGDVNFITSFQMAKKQATEQNKLIFVDVMADWCGPCKKMMADLRINKEACDFFNENYINLKINEKYEKAFLNEYNISSFPTILFLSGNGEVIEAINGYPGIQYILTTAKNLHTNKDKYKNIEVKLDDNEVDENQFVREFSQNLVKLSPNFREKNIQKYLDAGEPYTKIILKHFGSMVSYPVFSKYYNQKKHDDAVIKEQLLISFLLHESNYTSNDKIRKGSKDLSKIVGLPQSKINAFMIAYKEFALMRQFGLTSEQNLMVYARSLLNNYPETEDVNLLYDAIITVIRNEKDQDYFVMLEPTVKKLSTEKPHYIYLDFLGVIYAKQGKKEDAARAIAEASKIAGSMNVKYTPLISQYRKEILE